MHGTVGKTFSDCTETADNRRANIKNVVIRVFAFFRELAFHLSGGACLIHQLVNGAPINLVTDHASRESHVQSLQTVPHESASRPYAEPQWQVHRFADADTWAYDDVRIGHRSAVHNSDVAAAGERHTIVSSVNSKGGT